MTTQFTTRQLELIRLCTSIAFININEMLSNRPYETIVKLQYHLDSLKRQLLAAINQKCESDLIESYKEKITEIKKIIDLIQKNIHEPKITR